MFPLCVVAALLAQTPDAQYPPLGVVRVSKRPGADALAAKMTARVLQAINVAAYPAALPESVALERLKKAGEIPRACQRVAECWKRLARALGPNGIVVGVDLGRVGQRLAVHLEAVSVDSAEPLAAIDFTASAANWADESTASIDTFTKQLLAAIPPPAAVAHTTADAPKKDEVIVPPPVFTSTTRLDEERSGSGPPLVVPVGFAIGAVAVGAIAATFTILGSHERGVVNSAIIDDGTVSTLPMSELNGHIKSGNTDFTIALTTAIVAAAIAITSAILFATR